jgi:hypothetical protein
MPFQPGGFLSASPGFALANSAKSRNCVSQTLKSTLTPGTGTNFIPSVLMNGASFVVVEDEEAGKLIGEDAVP